MSIFTTPGHILVSCARGIAPLLSEELRALGFPVRREQEAAVETEGTLDDTLRLNLCLRTAQRVLFQLDRFFARTPEQMYTHVNKLPWETYIAADGYVGVASFIRTPSIRDARFANVKCKDAIVDRIRE